MSNKSVMIWLNDLAVPFNKKSLLSLKRENKRLKEKINKNYYHDLLFAISYHFLTNDLTNVIKFLETFCVAESWSSIEAYKIFRILLFEFYFFYIKFILEYFYLFAAKNPSNITSKDK